MTNKQKTYKRKCCTECGGNIYAKGFDDSDKPVFICNCCGNKTDRKVRVSRKQKMLDELFNAL